MRLPVALHFFASVTLITLATVPIAGASAEVLTPPGATIDESTWQQWQGASDRKAEDLQQFAAHSGSPSHLPSYLNALILESSPYLLQHASNPVNWVSWSAQNLSRALTQKKLVFLSIGYSTCHWCHVMNKESFTDPTIARLINENFVAIKVDREEMPAIDQHYSELLAMVKGSAGWPLTAILDANGRAIFLESYLSPADLTALLARVVQLGQQQPEFLNSSAQLIESIAAASGAVVETNVQPLSLEELAVLTQTVLSGMDTAFGGLIGDQKFPNESLLLFLSQMDLRLPDKNSATAMQLQLSKMISGGLYDPVNGGFFRYSTDRYWASPHFEKMLYNQALLLQVYSAAFISSGSALYRWLLLDLTDFIKRWLYQPAIGYASAINADSDGQEGFYYRWPAATLAQLPAADIEEARLTTYPASSQTVLLGVALQAPETAAAGRIRAGLHKENQAKSVPFIDQKVVASWNAATLSGLIAAHHALGAQSPIPDADDLERIAQLLWSNLYSTDTGRLSRTFVQSQRRHDATLEDYAYMLQALVDIYDLTAKQKWLQRSHILAQNLLADFVSADGDFTYARGGSTGVHVKEPARIKDAELPAADAVAIQALWRLAHREGGRGLKPQLRRPISKLRDKFRAQPTSQLYAGSVLATIDLGSVAPLQYFAGGQGKLTVTTLPMTNQSSGCASASVDIHLQPGWHINSATPMQDYLRPTEVSVRLADQAVSAATITYPEANITSLGFQKEALSVYTDRVAIGVVPVDIDACSSGARLSIDVQACTDKICLAPETLSVVLGHSGVDE